MVGAALAHYAWDGDLRLSLVANGMTYERVKAEEAGEISSSRVIVDRLVYNYFQTRGSFG